MEVGEYVCLSGGFGDVLDRHFGRVCGMHVLLVRDLYGDGGVCSVYIVQVLGGGEIMSSAARVN